MYFNDFIEDFFSNTLSDVGGLKHAIGKGGRGMGWGILGLCNRKEITTGLKNENN